MTKKNNRNLSTVNAVVNEVQKSTKITNKEEKNMKNEVTKNTGAVVTLTKKCVGTVTFTQSAPGAKVIYTAYGKPAEITADQVKGLVAMYLADDWKMGEVIEHKAASVKEPKATINYSNEYQKKLAAINDPKLASIKNPEKTTKTEKVKKQKMEQRAIEKDAKPVETDKPQTKKEAMTAKYGEGYGKRWNAFWNEEAAKLAEEVKKTGKRLPKAEWKKTMNERVKARLA